MTSLIKQTLGIEIDFYFVFVIWFLIFIRIFMMLLLTPFLGSRAVPARGRVAVAVALSIFLYPLLTPGLKNNFPEHVGLLLPLFLKEAFFGFTIGLVTIMVFYALEAAGSIVDNQRGGGNAQVFVPQLGQVSIFGLFNFWLAIAFFISVGGHRHFLEAFISSYQTVPLLDFPAQEPGISAFLELMIRLSGDVLIIAVQFAAPVLIAVLLVDLVLGLANKMAPQINVFELGFAVKGYVGPLMIYVSILILVTQMDVILKVMIKNVYEVAKLFGR